MQKVRAEIYLKNIQSNARVFKTLCGVSLCAVVKADAYGHGAERVACALERIADCFAVSILDEAIKIRTAVCGKDIIILTPPTSEQEIYLAAKNGFIISVGDLSCAKLVEKTARLYQTLVRVHLKVNTGMNRYGMDIKTLERVCKLFVGQNRVCVEGLYSHLYGESKESAVLQRERFEKMRTLAKRFFENIRCHLSATRGVLLGEAYRYDMVRIGIGLYGYLPNGEKNLPLKKAMKVYAQVTATGRYTGGGAGYGEHPAHIKKGERIHVCRFGYADGFLRKRKNGTHGFEKNANNLCMDACVRKGYAKKGDWITVLDDAEKTAKITGTIAYEVLCSATRRAEIEYLYE